MGNENCYFCGKEIEVDDELEEVKAQWSELHDGKKPHHTKKLAKLKAEIQAKLDEQDSE